MKWVENKCDDTGGIFIILAGGDINSRVRMHRSDSRDLVVSRHSPGKHAAALGPVAKDRGPTYYC
eukprot:7999963-Pyramimonas_sp.AAC.1